MMKVFAVRDVKSDSFNALGTAVSRGVAAREFGEAVLQKGSQLSKYHQDYMLYELGTYDESTGRMESHQTPILVATASSFVNAQVQAEPSGVAGDLSKMALEEVAK